MYSSVQLETWVVLAPQAVDTVGFLDHRLYHLRFVVRKVVWYIQHDIADQIAYRGNRVSGDVL